MYPWLKILHIGIVILSGGLFAWRAWLAIRIPDRLQLRRYRVLPHVIDTFLLLSGIGLMVISGMYPMDHAWLSAKLVALIVYIVLGNLAIKRMETARHRAIAATGALLVFAYMVTVAVQKTALPFLSTA